MSYLGNIPSNTFVGPPTALNVIATSNQTVFSIAGGYIPGFIEVYQNGVRLANSLDYTATNATSVTLNVGATLNDLLIFIIKDNTGTRNIASADYANSAGYAVAMQGGVAGNIVYQSASSVSSFLANGSSGQYLQSTGSGLSWVTPSYQSLIGTISGIAKGNGANALTAAIAGTDYVAPSSAVTWTSTQVYQAQQSFQSSIVETPLVASVTGTYTITERTQHDLTMTGNTTFTFPSLAAGKQFTMWLNQDVTGSRVPTLPSTVRWSGGTAPTWTTTASKTDIVSFMCDGTYWMGFVGGQNFTRA